MCVPKMDLSKRHNTVKATLHRGFIFSNCLCYSMFKVFDKKQTMRFWLFWYWIKYQYVEVLCGTLYFINKERRTVSPVVIQAHCIAHTTQSECGDIWRVHTICNHCLCWVWGPVFQTNCTTQSILAHNTARIL